MPGHPPTHTTPALQPPPASPLARTLIDIEETWLGFRSPPLNERLRRAEWAPDDPTLVCPRCAATCGPYEADDEGCPICRGRKLPWTRCVRLGPYDSVLGELVREIKFNRFRTLGVSVGHLLGLHLKATLQAAGLDPRQALLVPLPISRRRYLERGIDHTLTLARGVSRASGLPIAKMLSRTHSPTQLAVTPGRRTANVKGTFRLRRWPSSTPAQNTIILLDDVRTTGATLEEAARTLRKSLLDKGQPQTDGPTIWTAVVAVSDPRP